MDLFGVVRRLHNTDGNSSTHASQWYEQSLLDASTDHAICLFNLPIRLGVCDRGVVEFDSLVCAEVFEIFCSEVRNIDGDDTVGTPNLNMIDLMKLTPVDAVELVIEQLQSIW